MSKLTLVGSVHCDNKGYERFTKVLDHYKPNIICLESTLDGYARAVRGHFDFVHKMSILPLQRIFSPDEIERSKIVMNASYFESWVPYSYKNGSKDIRIICIEKEDIGVTCKDLDERGKSWLSHQLSSGRDIREFITPLDEDIITLVKNENKFNAHQKCVDETYFNDNHYEDFITQFGINYFDQVVTQRDKNFASKIRILSERNPSSNILAILGCNHIFGTYSGNTYELLSDLSPQRIRLIEADSLLI